MPDEPSSGEIQLVMRALARIEKQLDQSLSLAQSNHDKIVRMENGGIPLLGKLVEQHRDLHKRVTSLEQEKLVEIKVGEAREKWRLAGLGAGGGAILAGLLKLLEMLLGTNNASP